MIDHLHNQNDQVAHRRALRNAATPQERMLWARLRGEQFEVRFRRQYSIGRYILDFYCPSLKIAIEIDGSQHLDAVAYDDRRSEFLAGMGILVLRFGNDEVNTNIDGVCVAIEVAVRDLVENASTPTQSPPG